METSFKFLGFLTFLLLFSLDSFLVFDDTLYNVFAHLNKIYAGYKFQILFSRILVLTSLLASSSSVVVLLLASEAAGGFYKIIKPKTKQFFLSHC